MDTGNESSSADADLPGADCRADPSQYAGPLDDVLRSALEEDQAAHDVTARALVGDAVRGTAVVRAKADGVIAGLTEARRLYALIDGELTFESELEDGARVVPGDLVLRVSGPLRGILAGERTALNVMQRMSGIATQTAQFVAAVAGTQARILATRKTAPGLRVLDHAAVRAGGGDVHRGSLGDRVLVKENHLAALRVERPGASMTGLVRVLLARVDGDVGIGIEVTSLSELEEVLVPGVDVVLLDNLEPTTCARAVALRRGRFPDGGGPELEASGGIDLATVRAFAEAGVERISVGAVTHSVTALDLSMLVTLESAGTASPERDAQS